MSKEGEKAYLVGGVNGVGKSSLIQEISKLYPEFEVFRGSAKFIEWLGLPPGDYESLRKLPEDYKNIELHRMMAEVLKKGAPKDRTLLVDAHYFNYKRGALIDATGEWISQLDALFVVSASPKTILRRLELDRIRTGHTRDILPSTVGGSESLELLNRFLQKTTEKARELSEKYGIPYFVIDNDREGLNFAVERFLEYHSSIEHAAKLKL